MRFGIGTAQFGMDYGISNTGGRTLPEEVDRILRIAAEAGVRDLDTAAVYGESETVLGERLPAGHGFRIVTKTSPDYSAAGGKYASLEQALDASLARLRQHKVYGLLVHRAPDLLGGEAERRYEELRALKENGKVEKIGVSVYSGEEIDALAERFRLDLVQVPISVLDQRLLASGHLARLLAAGIEVHARSVFLQGLLLMPLERIPAHFEPIKPLLAHYHRSVREQGLSLLEAALGFVKRLTEVNVLFVGASTARQLQACIDAYRCAKSFDGASFACFDPEMVNPSRWPIA